MLKDISFKVSKSFIVYPGDPKYLMENIFSIENHGYNVSKISMGSHFSTHIDAPHHFFEFGKTISDFDINDFSGKAHVIEISEGNINKTHIDSINIEENDIILFKANPNFDGTKILNSYNALLPEAAMYLVDKKVKLVGIDYISIEPENNTDFSTHKILLNNNIPILESIDLRQVNAGIYHLFAFPINIENSDAAPVRAVLKFYWQIWK